MFWNKKQKEDKKLKFAAVLFFGMTVVCNALANILPINGQNSGEISDSYPNLFAPIGFTFSIWSVIYLLLLAFCVYQFSGIRGKKSKVNEQTLNKILPYFIGTSILNSAWIFSWHYRQIALSVLLITGILVCLIRIAGILKNQNYSGLDQLLVKTPFSIYFGWITVAVIANITVWLVSIGWNGMNFSEIFWVSAILVIGSIIALLTAERNNDPLYLLVIIWAYFGILFKHLSPSGFNEQYPEVIIVLVITLGALSYKLSRMKATIAGYFKP